MDTGDYCKPTVATTLTTPRDSLDYNMCHRSRGICLIIENETFALRGPSTRHLTKRIGSDVDRNQLVNLFDKLSFHVIVQRDLRVSGVREILRQVSHLDHTDSDCFVCIVLSHGEYGELYAHDQKYPIEMLFNPFLGDACPTLVGKPKLFFIQACQGNRLDPGIIVTARDSIDQTISCFKIPTYADFMIAYSTLPGFYSFRNTEKGSWFIRSLVEVLHEYHLEFDLLTMMTMVCHQVAYNFTSNASTQELCGKKQVPCITSMLTRRVFLHPKSLQI